MLLLYLILLVILKFHLFFGYISLLVSLLEFSQCLLDKFLFISLFFFLVDEQFFLVELVTLLNQFYLEKVFWGHIHISIVLLVLVFSDVWGWWWRHVCGAVLLAARLVDQLFNLLLIPFFNDLVKQVHHLLPVMIVPYHLQFFVWRRSKGIFILERDILFEYAQRKHRFSKAWWLRVPRHVIQLLKVANLL